MYAELQQGICDYLEEEEDIYGLPVIAEAPPNTQKTVEERLTREGVVLMVGKPRQQARGASEVVVQIPLVIIENHEVNMNGEDGLERQPDQIITDIISSLDRYQPEAFWTPINARPFDSRDPEFGQWGYGVMVETKTLIVREWAILVDHNGNGISDASYRAFQTTNRGR